jgi:CubicO group peptidase (beta-lactamase class C family)
MGTFLDAAPVRGFVKPGFEPVWEAFVENFAQRGEVGAACSVVLRGEVVVDLWGGFRDKVRRLPWCPDTVIPVFSASKGMSMMALLAAHGQGLLDFEQPVATYWPEFAANGKEAITIRQLLAHQAGLCILDTPISLADIRRWEPVQQALASQRPAWTPGEYHGYHAVSLGWYQAELIHRVDPKGRSFAQFYQEEVAEPLGLAFRFGVPPHMWEGQIATIEPVSLWQMPFHLDALPWKFVKAFLNPWSISSRTIQNPSAFRDPSRINDRAFQSLLVPSVVGIGDARSMARAYGYLAVGGDRTVLTNRSVHKVIQSTRTPTNGVDDLVLQMPVHYSMGFMRPCPAFPFSRNSLAFGTPGAGGALGFADADIGMGFAYTPSRMSFHVFGDPREAALRDAVYRCLS